MGGWEGGKSFYTVWQETKTESHNEHENCYPKMSLVPINRKKKERKKAAIREQTTRMIFTDCQTVQATFHIPLPFCHSILHVLLAYLLVCPRLRELAPSHQPQMVDHR